MDSASFLVVGVILLCGVAPAIYAAKKRCWKEIAVWAVATLLAFCVAYLARNGPLGAVVYAFLLCIDYGLYRVAEKK